MLLWCVVPFAARARLNNFPQQFEQASQLMRDQLVLVEPRENVVDDRVRNFSDEDGPGKAVSEVRAHGSDGEANRGGHKGLAGWFIFQLGFGFNGWGSSPSGCTTSSCNAQDDIIEVAATHD